MQAHLVVSIFKGLDMKVYLSVILMLVGIVGGGVSIRHWSQESTVSRTSVRLLRSEVQLDTMLTSEVRARSQPVEGEFVFLNDTDKMQEIIFDGVSCGCTGLFSDNTKIEKGEHIDLTGGGSIAFRLRADLSGKQGKNRLEAWFKVPSKVGGRTEQLTAVCVARVFPDVRVKPEVLVCSFRESDKTSIIKTLTVERIFRVQSAAATMAPHIRGLPSGSRVVGVEEIGDRVEIEGNLWKRSWKVDVRFEFTEEISVVPAPRRLIVAFEDSTDLDPMITEVPLLMRHEFGIEAPKSIHFGRVELTRTYDKRILLRAADGKEFTIVSVSCDSPSLKVKDVNRRPSVYHWLDLHLTPMSVDEGTATISVETNHSNCKQITIDAAFAVNSTR